MRTIKLLNPRSDGKRCWLRNTARCLLVLAALALFPAAGRAQQRTATASLDTTQFLVVGEGLSAGMADFALREVYQDRSFPAQMARQMNALMPLPLIQSPGIGSVPGFPSFAPRLPGVLQGPVRTPFPPYLFVFNLAVPGIKMADVATRRPVPPLVQPRDPQQTLINFILGYPALIAGANLPLWSQTEYAVQMNPTFVIVELGYYDVLEPAVNNDPSQLPDVATFRTQFSQLLSSLGASSPQILVLTIPNPFDTAYFTPLSGVTALTGLPADVLQSKYALKPDDLVTPNGLVLLGNLTLGKVELSPFFPGLETGVPGTVVSAATRAAVTDRVTALNHEIVSAAQAAGGQVYDLNALFARLKVQGLSLGNTHRTADYLGGLYSLDGFYPGVTVQGVIANELLAFLNTTYGKSYPMLDLNKIANDDPAIRFTPARAKVPKRLESQ